MSLNIEKIRQDFPVLQQEVYGKPLIYFDNAATTQKPLEVIDTISSFYKNTNSNIHRGVHFLSEKSTGIYESARKTVQEFIGAKELHEIIFTAGTTASINTIAFSFGEKFISEGDEIIVSVMEHHANIVPWQLLAERKNAKLKVIPMNEKGELNLDNLDNLFSKHTKILAITQVSNSLGTINPVKGIIAKAHTHNVPVLIDGAQSIQHSPVDVQELDCDFFVFSGHKIYGPTGIGVLYGKEKWLEQLPPYQSGGDMIKNVSFEKTTFNELPFKFEAGTMNYVGAAGLATAIKYVEKLDLNKIYKYEKRLLDFATEELSKLEGIKIYGTAENKISVLSFLPDNIHQYDVGMILDKMGIAVRTGTHCTEPVMKHFDINGTVRASFSFYNTIEEIDHFIESIKKIQIMFG